MANDLAPTYPYVPVPPLRGGKRGNADKGTTWERRGNGWERVGTGQIYEGITGTGRERVTPYLCMFVRERRGNGSDYGHRN
jgi:hypothetical protein